MVTHVSWGVGIKVSKAFMDYDVYYGPLSNLVPRRNFRTWLRDAWRDVVDSAENIRWQVLRR